jgi:hypothetical protein
MKLSLLNNTDAVISNPFLKYSEFFESESICNLFVNLLFLFMIIFYCYYYRTYSPIKLKKAYSNRN